MAILDRKRLEIPRLSTQRGSVDNHGNLGAQTATNAAIIPRTVSIRELIHASSAPTCLAGRSSFIRSIQAGPRGTCTWYLFELNRLL